MTSGTLATRMSRAIAIIGANGFVGRHIVDLARSRGLAVVGVVRSESAAGALSAAGATPLLISALNEGSRTRLADGLAGCVAVIHTAGVTAGSGNDRTDPRGLITVVDAANDAGVSHVVYFSGLGVAHYGMNAHCTNTYFLAKLAGELATFRSALTSSVFRPSYIFGPGEEFLGPLIRRILRDSTIEIPGDGGYRLQPIAVEDAAAAALAAVARTDRNARTWDLVGPEVLTYRELIERTARVLGRVVSIRETPMATAAEAAQDSDYFGLRAHELACLLCDEVSDAGPIESLVGRALEGVDAMIRRTAASIRSGA